MKEVSAEMRDGVMRVSLSGHIDSNNASEIEKELFSALSGSTGVPVAIDAERLEYISSAGLRVLLHLRKAHPELRIINVGSQVYEILDMTGFTQMISVEKAYRTVSVEGCEIIGKGANGTIYRIDMDNVVKVYNDADALQDIQNEREVARLALILGIPTAISYDVVKVGDSYGSVFELLNAQPFAKILAEQPEKMDWCVQEYVKLLRKIHGTLVPKGKLPDLRDTVIGWAEFVKDYLPEEAGTKLVRLVEEVPQDDHMIHGDYHTRNIELQGNEVLLIDMDTLAVGHPVFELGSMFNSFVGFSECDKEQIVRFQGYNAETGKTFWHKVLAAYLGTENEDIIKAVEDKARIVGYTRLIRRSIRRGGLETEQSKAEIEHWKAELLEILDRTDSLIFSPNEMFITAKKENLPAVINFINSKMEAAGCPMRTVMQVDVAAEEIFVNVALYAYEGGEGPVSVRVDIPESRGEVIITFTDSGMPFDPLAKEDPDIGQSAEQRSIGGLGIFMVKKTMDSCSYEYRDGKNVFTMKKNL